MNVFFKLGFVLGIEDSKKDVFNYCFEFILGKMLIFVYISRISSKCSDRDIGRICRRRGGFREEFWEEVIIFKLSFKE